MLVINTRRIRGAIGRKNTIKRPLEIPKCAAIFIYGHGWYPDLDHSEQFVRWRKSTFGLIRRYF